MTPAEIEDVAEALFAAEITGQQVSLVSHRFPDMTQAEAYAVQAAIVAKKKATGRRPVGWKIGLTSRVMQRALGVDMPDSGVLFDDMAFAEGAAIPEARFLQPRVEAEIAFLMKADLAGPADAETVLAATDYVTPALEIVDTRLRDPAEQTGAARRVVDTISDNASTGGYVLGAAQNFPNAADMRWAGVILKRDGLVEETGLGAGVLDDPVASVVWLTAHLAAQGQSIRSGDIVLSGSLVRPIAARPGTRFDADFGAFGRVGVAFA